MLPFEWKYLPAVLEERARVAAAGDLRARIRFDLEGRPPYAWGLLTAADSARFFGYGKIVAIEFGVAEGGGLLEMCRLAPMITQLTNVEIDVVGFDNGVGLPPPADYRDHPEIWSAGDFAMPDPQLLRQQLPSGARLILGDIADTLGPFLETMEPGTPIGFCSFDVDIYSSSMAALRVYAADPRFYLPVGIAYCDDTLGSPERFGSLTRNRKAGQLLAIDEFNTAVDNRVIDTIRTLRYRRPLQHEQWLEQVYGVHILDHPARNAPRRREGRSLEEHADLSSMDWPF